MGEVFYSVDSVAIGTHENSSKLRRKVLGSKRVFAHISRFKVRPCVVFSRRRPEEEESAERLCH